MDYKLVIKPRAENDLAEGIAWYESRRKGMGLIFLNWLENIWRASKEILCNILQKENHTGKLSSKSFLM